MLGSTAKSLALPSSLFGVARGTRTPFLRVGPGTPLGRRSFSPEDSALSHHD
jgi:hypothetical protein